jgi:spermidine synthase
MTSLLCAIFFLSGAAALLFETLWFQQAGLAFGNSVWASSLVMAGFMGGLALGNGLAARLGPRIGSPVRLYGILEGVIGLTGLALVYGLPAMTPIVARMLAPVLDEIWLQHVIRLSLAFTLLLVPSTAMGATLPLLVKELYARDPHFGRVLGRLYGWNTLGAVTGALVGHALMTSWIGIRGAGWVAASTNLVVAFVALWMWKASSRGPSPSPSLSPGASPRTSGTPISSRGRYLLAAAALCGLIMLALEVVWFRFLLLFIHGTSLTFAVMLAVVLAGIGLGGLVGARWLGVRPNSDRQLPLVACASGMVVVSTYAGFGRIAGSLTRLGLLQRFEVVSLSLALMLPCALLSGVLFTMLGHAFQREVSGEIRPAGLATLANTLGAMLGSVIGGFLLLPLFGVEYSIQILAALYALAAIFIWSGGLCSNRSATLAAGFALLLMLFWVPVGSMDGYMRRVLAPHIKRGAIPVVIREGLTETAMLLEHRRFGQKGTYKLLTNSFAMSTTGLHARRYMKLFVYWPVAIHPDPKRALLISYGVGATAQALVDTQSFEVIDVVDISRDILDMSSTIYSDPKRDPLEDPRVTLHVEDGRHFLETRQQRYDLITGEPPPPKVAGITNLFSKEYFAAIRARLNEGGITTYWLPVHGLVDSETKAIIRAFCDVFEDCSLWNGASLDWILIGTRGVETQVSMEHFAQQWADPLVAPELRALGIEKPEQLGALFMGDAEFLKGLTKDTPPLDDDHPGRLGTQVVGPRETLPLYRDWLDVEAARERFVASSLIEKLWPSKLRESSPAYFTWQQVVVDFLTGRFQTPEKVLPTFDRIQSDSSLRTLPLWVLGSTRRAQDQARRAEEAGRVGPAISYERALQAMAEGDYPSAIDGLFGRRSTAKAWYLRIYALYRADRIQEAREALARTPRRVRDPQVERFLEEKFVLADDL